MVSERRHSFEAGAELMVGVDSSSGSRAALHWAAETAQILGSPLRVVEAWEYPRDTVVRIGRVELPSPEEADALLAEHLEYLVAEVVGEDREEPPISTAVLRGPASEALQHAADGAGMIVVGSRGLGGFRGLLLGSVSRQLCEHAPCPVTVIRRGDQRAPVGLDTIAVGVDGSAHAAAAVAFTADLARLSGARVIAVHAAAPGAMDTISPGPAISTRRTTHDLLEDWCAPLEERGQRDHDLVVAEGDPRTALLEVAEERGADLLVVGSRGLGPVQKLVLGSVATSLIQHAHVPVTVVPRPGPH